MGITLTPLNTMLISIKRHYIESDEVREIIINTRYIYKVEPSQDEGYPKTRIILVAFSKEDPLSFMYTDESLSVIKGKISKARKTIQSEDD